MKKEWRYWSGSKWISKSVFLGGIAFQLECSFEKCLPWGVGGVNEKVEKEYAKQDKWSKWSHVVKWRERKFPIGAWHGSPDFLWQIIVKDLGAGRGDPCWHVSSHPAACKSSGFLNGSVSDLVKLMVTGKTLVLRIFLKNGRETTWINPSLQISFSLTCGIGGDMTLC